MIRQKEHQKIAAFIATLFARYFQSLENTGSAVQFVEKASHILKLEKADGVAVFKALDQGGHEELTSLFQAYCHDIAILIFNLQSLLLIEKVTIGGGISSQPLLIDEISRQYHDLLSQKGHKQFEALPIQASASTMKAT